MSVEKELLIKIGDDHKLALLTGINIIPNTMTLQIHYQQSKLGVALDPEHLKVVIESLEEIYYKLDLKDEPAVFEPQPDYVSKIAELKLDWNDTNDKLAKSLDENRKLRAELCEKEAYIGSLIANLKAETDNVTQLRANINLEKKKNKKHTIKHVQEIEAAAKEIEENLGYVSTELKQVKIERDDFRDKFHKAETELIKIKTSGGVFTEDVAVYSHGLNLVAKERQKQFNLGRTIEKDVVYYRHKEYSLISLAMFYLNEGNYGPYPESWIEMSEKVLAKPHEERVKIAASLLIAHLDMKQYIEFQNNTQNRRG